ncbi:MAG: TylF/MycF family methyltransferase [Oscillospiraceae bacterium]|jgi:O-methyltransferase|nr:TylF/MycF family methyltransferase [Oscillospiraceae bacterium]
MKKIIIFGVGDLGLYLYEKYKQCFEILFFVDNKVENNTDLPLPLLSPTVLKTTDFDKIYIASASGLEDIYSQLLYDFRIPKEKINRVWSESHHEPLHIASRIRFLEDFAEYCYYHKLDGDCAEVGVYRGAFAREINRVFSDKKLYLFDTFSGFDKRDLIVERQENDYSFTVDNHLEKGYLNFTETSVDKVMEVLPYPQNAIIKQGFFPDTFDLNKEKFIFVNLDTDLYQPIKDGLEIFYPRMSFGGVILIHDYYSMLHGVSVAVDEFVKKYGIAAIPIGDYKSIAIIKN